MNCACGEKLDPEQTYETDLPLPGRKTRGYRQVCSKCYKKMMKKAATQVGAGRQELTVGKTSKVAAFQLSL